MIKDLFLQIVKLSLSAALIAGVVMLLRLVFRKKAPRSLICALWILVAVRLLIPSLPESKVSVVPEEVSGGSVVSELAERPMEATVRVKENEPQYVTIIQKRPELAVKREAESGTRYVEVSSETLDAPKTVGNTVLPVLSVIWLSGIGVMLLYMAFSYFRIWRKVRISLHEEENI